MHKLVRLSGVALVLVLLLSWSVQKPKGRNSDPGPIPRFEWHQSFTGGGGYITGILQHPRHPRTWYARCDVAGMFRSDDGGRSWQALNSGMSKWYHHSVQSIAVSPHDPDVLFRCSGDVRNNTIFGSIHKSTDGGKSWREVSSQVGYYGNGPTRMFGELIAVDPFHARRVVTAGYANGIWQSRDTGESWQPAGLKEERFGSLAFHPGRKNRLYAGTLPKHGPGRLFASADGGHTWELLFEGAGLAFAELAFDGQNPEIIYAACAKGGIYRSTDGGRHFEKKMKGLPEGRPYNTIVAGTGKNTLLYTAVDARPDGNMPPIPVYRSEDGGESWQLIRSHRMSELQGYPAYIQKPEKAGWAIAKVRIDRSNPERLFYSNWYGVATSPDGGHTWEANQFKGLETNCLESIQRAPAAALRTYYTVADHAPAVSYDGGQTYRMLPPTPQFVASTALVQSAFDSTLVLYGSRTHGKAKKAAIIRVTGGRQTEVAREFPAGSFVQCLKEDPFTPGTFYAYLDGVLVDGAGLYHSTDWGKSWSQLPLRLPAHIRTLPHERAYIENELLNIVVGQTKNVCGTNQLLCPDPHRKNTLYFGEWTEGVLRSDDAGQTWHAIGTGLPFGRDTASVLTVLKADGKRPGWLYAGFIREGLWRSKDYGQTWQKLFPTDAAVQNVNSLHIGGATGQELYLAGEHLYWAQSPPAVWYSPDNGHTWRNLYDKELGALRLKAIDVDPKTGRVFVASSGNGAFYLERIIARSAP